MADLTVNAFSGGVITQTLVSANAGGDAIPGYDGKQFLVVTNGSGGSINVTLNSQVVCDQGSDHDLVIAVAAGATRQIKAPAPATRWQDTNGKLQISYSGVTSLSIGAFKWPE